MFKTRETQWAFWECINKFDWRNTSNEAMRAAIEAEVDRRGWDRKHHLDRIHWPEVWSELKFCREYRKEA